MNILRAFYKIKSETCIDSGKNIEILESFRNSILCTYNNKYYLISVCHYIYANTTIYILLKEYRLKINISHILYIPELDIMIIDVTNNKDFNDKYKIDLSNINYKINDINQHTPLFVIDSCNQIQSTNIQHMQISKFNNLYPALLKYFANKPCINLEGYSGSPVFDRSNNVLGIVNGYCSNYNYMTITPLFFIKRILDELCMYNIFGGLCGFYQQYNIEKRELLITKKEDIDHNIYIKNIKEYNISKLLQEDKIIEVDNIPVDMQGNIYCDLIGMSIDLNSYINITKTINDITKFKVFRDKNKIYKNITVIMGNRDYYSSLTTSIKLNSLETFWNKNKLYIKINSSLWDYIKKFKNIDDDENLFNIFQMKLGDKIETNYLLVEDIVLNKNIFTNNVSDYIVKKFIF